MNLTAIEAKPFVPAKDFALAQRFYGDLRFTIVWCADDLAYLRHGRTAFLLQDDFAEAFANNFKMHLLVENVDDWWLHVHRLDIGSRYCVRAEPPENRSWGLRDFPLFDPSGVLVADRPVIEDPVSVDRS